MLLYDDLGQQYSCNTSEKEARNISLSVIKEGSLQIPSRAEQRRKNITHQMKQALTLDDVQQTQ